MKVAIIDKSRYYANNIKNVINKLDSFSFAGHISESKNLTKQLKDVKADIVILGSDIDGLSSLSILKSIMIYNKIPVIFFPELGPETFSQCYRSLELGAIDFMIKPIQSINTNWNLFLDMIKEKLDIASESAVGKIKKIEPVKLRKRTKKDMIIIIASSTGGVQTNLQLIPALPKNLAVPVVLVQHMPKHFTKEFAQNLNRASDINVKEAEDNEELLPGNVYVAKGGYHLEFKQKNDKVNICFNERPPVMNLRPYANYTFFSAVDIYKSNVIGIVLSGMGSDGTEGLKMVKQAGGITIAQSKKDCILYGMPKSAIETKAAEHVVDLDKIPKTIVEMMG